MACSNTLLPGEAACNCNSHTSQYHERSLADPHGCDDLSIAANEHAVFNDGCMLFKAVIITGNDTGADIHVSSHGGVTDIGEMIRFTSLAQGRLLHFHEIPYLCPLPDY